jgi:hypothetical protein
MARRCTNQGPSSDFSVESPNRAQPFTKSGTAEAFPDNPVTTHP